MIRTLIADLYWNSYEKRCDAEQKKAKETKEILEKTAYLRSHPDSIFYVKPF